MKAYREREAVDHLMLNAPEEVATEFVFPGSDTGSHALRILIHIIGAAETLSVQQREKLEELLCEFGDTFGNQAVKTELLEHDIELISDGPIRSRAYLVSPKQKDFLAAEIQPVLSVIVHSDSEYASPLILPRH